LTVAWAGGEKRIEDVRGFVVKAFQAHNKDISRGVYLKLDNTEIMIRCFRERAGYRQDKSDK
jgi:hypothetical protein